jgi:hypothetical protein
MRLTSQMNKLLARTIAIIIGLLAITSFVATSLLSNQVFPKAAADWQLHVSGLVSNPLDLSLADLAAMPQTTVEATILCVDFPNQPVASGKWTGVKLSTLFEQAGVMPSAIKVAFYAADGYSTDLDLATATYGNIIIAYQKDGAPLGETLRLVVPGKWGYKWISQVTDIVLVDYDFKGKWENQGYSDAADIQLGSSIARPQTEPAFPNPIQSSQPAVPSPSPQASNSSTAVPSQETPPSSPGPEPQPPSSFPTAWIALAVAFVLVGTCLLVYVKKRPR